MMVVEIAAGWTYNSMALMADGFHMSSHAVAIGLSAFAYAAARRHAKDLRYAFERGFTYPAASHCTRAMPETASAGGLLAACTQ